MANKKAREQFTEFLASLTGIELLERQQRTQDSLDTAKRQRARARETVLRSDIEQIVTEVERRKG